MRKIKKDIGRFEKTVAPIFLFFAIIFTMLGIFMIVDGVRDVLYGGYRDNVILGVIVLVSLPPLSIITFIVITMTDKQWWN